MRQQPASKMETADSRTAFSRRLAFADRHRVGPNARQRDLAWLQRRQWNCSNADRYSRVPVHGAWRHGVLRGAADSICVEYHLLRARRASYCGLAEYCRGPRLGQSQHHGGVARAKWSTVEKTILVGRVGTRSTRSYVSSELILRRAHDQVNGHPQRVFHVRARSADIIRSELTGQEFHQRIASRLSRRHSEHAP